MKIPRSVKIPKGMLIDIRVKAPAAIVPLPPKKRKAQAPEFNPLTVRALYASFGIPDFESEYVFHPTRKWRFDIAWPKFRLALEVEGGLFVRGRHSRGAGILKDFEKYNAATVLGWRILRTDPNGLTGSDLTETILACLAP